ncbi:hypothetical protein VNO77_09615 [Canavalia gladiata]|uniref:Uncharacterized protein n=1 Tax=Canavalia gladiata TaxID=3824 RepID=A0AAN9MA14_CANGL
MATANLSKKLVVNMMVTVLIMLVSEPQAVESAFAIPLNPCTLAQCIAECKKILQGKFMSATCASNSQGKLCICLG